MEIAFYNAFQGSTIEDGTNLINFKPSENSAVSIADINMQSQGSIFTVNGVIRWIGEIQTIEGKKKKAEGESAKPRPKAVRDAVSADLTGHLVISLWEDLVDIKANKWYTFSHITTKQYNGMKLTSTRFSKADEFDSSEVLYWDDIAVDGQEKSLTIFRAELEKYFKEDIVNFPQSNLETRLLMLEDIDFIYNNKNVVVSVKDHTA